MIHSMTGYGTGHASMRATRVDVEVRSVNSRFLDVRCTFPKECNAFEPVARDLVQATVTRGQVSVFLAITLGAGAAQVRVNEALAKQTVQQLRRVAKQLRLDDAMTIDTLVRIPGIVAAADLGSQAPALQPTFEKALRAALKQLTQTRAKEGAALANDFTRRIATVQTAADAIRTHAPEVAQRFQERLTKRLRDAQAAAGIEFDAVRILTEMGVFNERTDITEELTRITSHLAQMNAALRQGGCIGKRLDFLLQELHRETTTIGNKANCASISRLVVQLKEELEKMREQAQNIE
jgi:uncharacterized protein (TIGR00255 family)